MNSFDILRRPIISERSMETVLDREGNEIKRYTFEVPKTVNKVIVTLTADSKTIEFFDI